MLITSISVFLIVSFILANLPWITDKILGLFPLSSGRKSFRICLLEWISLYFLSGLMAFGLEKKFTSEIYTQTWEFITVTICLFVVFALPGFLYRFELKHLLQRAVK